jgi:hypothetical protein
MITIVIPVLKDKKGDLSSKDNYRPVAITSVISKNFEAIILKRYQYCLVTSDNQFGFKRGHGTDLCTYTLKHVIDYFTSMGSPLFICYLDASKAFDRVNFWILFDNLLNRGMPAIVVRLLVFWYTKQTFIIRWGNSTSESFAASNGVRQGGVISPYFFNVYVDGLSIMLKETKKGCFINNTSFNHLMYADDIVLLSPSASGLQHMLKICENFASECDLVFNSKKSVYMCIQPKDFRIYSVPKVCLNGAYIKLVSVHKYLGIHMSNTNTDDIEMSKQLRNLYARGNTLVRNFSKCTNDVKCQLFSTYCSSLFGCQLWANYKQESLRRLRVAYNKIFRMLLHIRGIVSMSHVLLQYRIDHFNVIVRKLIVGLLQRIAESKNVLLQVIYKSSYFIYSKMFACWRKMVF